MQTAQKSRDKRDESWFLPLVVNQGKGLTQMEKAHVDALESKHASIQAQIDLEEQRPHPDDVLLHKLKKEKLRLKDEINGLTVH